MSRLPALVALALLASAHDLPAQDVSPAAPPSIVTSGEATVRRAPDEAFVMIASRLAHALRATRSSRTQTR